MTRSPFSPLTVSPSPPSLLLISLVLVQVLFKRGNLLRLSLKAQAIKAADHAVGNRLPLDDNGIEGTCALIDERGLSEDPVINTLQHYKAPDKFVNDFMLLHREILFAAKVTHQLCAELGCRLR